jgi:hypothetical protein
MKCSGATQIGPKRASPIKLKTPLLNPECKQIECGKLTVQQLCRHMDAHDMNHIDQVRRILGR